MPIRRLEAVCAYGPGLRWNVVGTFLSCRLAGGEAGKERFLKQFEPALQLPWTHTSVPEPTGGLIRRIVR